MNENKIKSVFLGKVVRKYYSAEDSYLSPRIYEYTETIRRESILELESDVEYMEKEEVYLQSLGKYTTIEKKTRSTDGSIVYNVTYVIDTIIDVGSKDVAEKELEEKIKLYNIHEEERIKAKQKDDEEYKKLLDEKSKIEPSKIIINRIPLDKNGKGVIDPSLAKKYTRQMVKTLPKDVIVLTTPFDTKVYDLNSDISEILSKIEAISKEESSNTIICE